MTKIRIHKRYKYAGDVFQALVEKAGWDIDTAVSFLNKIKDAKVEEVIRCKECIYNKYGSCEFAEDNDPNYDENYYCSDGEREE